MFDGIDKKLDLSATCIDMVSSEVVTEPAIIQFLNKNATRISNPTGQGITRWHFDDGEQVMYVFIRLQELTIDKDISFRWIEEKIPALIIQEGDTLPPPP